MTLVRNLSRLALIVCGSGLVVACASVLGFPDRTLEEGTTDGAETSTPDASVDLPDTSFDAGPPQAAFSRSAVDFGLVSCGANPPPDQTVTLTNTGGQPLTWAATLSATPQFAISGPAGGTLQPGQSGTIAITSIAIPALSGAGDTIQAKLTVTTNDPAKASTDFDVKATAGGGVLSIVPLTAAMGEAYYGTDGGLPSTDVPIAFRNVGNLPITVNFTQPTDTEFGVRWTAYPASVIVAPDAGLPGLVAKFTPNALGDSTSTAPIQIQNGAMCGTNPAEITVTGKGIGSPAIVQPGSLDFGMVNCGTTGAAQNIVVKNASNADFTIQTVTLGNGVNSSFTLPAVLPTTVAANSMVTIAITPKGIPTTSPVDPNYYGDTVTITTNAPADSAHTVPLLMTARGALLSQSAASIAFGSVRVTTTANSTFTVTNAGNAGATVSYATGTTTFSVAPQNQVVAGGSNYTATASFSPTAQQQYADTATMSVSPDTVLCAPLPGGIALSGQGAVSATLTPSSVDFGLVNCGTTGSAQNVTLTNTGTQAITSWTASLGKGAGSSFTLSATSGGKLTPGQSVVIKVTPKAIPGTSATTADLYGDTLSVTTSPLLESPYVVTLHMTAQGAILAYNPTSLAFGSVRAGRSASLPFSVVNTGNLAATYSLTMGGTNPSQFSVTPNTNVTVNASSSTAETAKFSPSSTGGKSATVSLSTSTVRCAPLPAALTLSGSGT